MVFNSLTFLIFFLVVWLAHQLPVSWTTRKRHLLLASYLFYAAWNPPFVLLIILSTVIDWFVAQAMGRTHRLGRRRVLLLISLTTNLGLLSLFKYGEFLADNAARFLQTIGVHYVPPEFDIILPVGISFYTFQTLSYTIDVYRGQLKPWPSFLDFALYVTFFPQLVAGPIVRAVEFLPQCREPRRPTSAQLSWGLTLLLIGLVEKTALADGLLAPIADTVYGAPDRAGFIGAWTGTLAFSAQIFFDFAGYSTCAIGVGMCLGFALPDNFRFPYAAVGFSDFWRRWHISLSSWLRDYLYIPLGGGRGSSWHIHRNLLITMLLGGLWHGASWRFVVWGALHGIYLVAERAIRRRWIAMGNPPLPLAAKVLLGLFTYYLVCLAWVFFRAADFGDALELIVSMFGGGVDQMGLGVTNVAIVLAVTLGLLSSHWWLRDSTLEDRWSQLRWPVRAVAISTMLILLMFTKGDDRAFIYFQF